MSFWQELLFSNLKEQLSHLLKTLSKGYNALKQKDREDLK